MPIEIKVLLLFLVVSIIYYKLKENNKTEREEFRQEQLHQSFMKGKNDRAR
tara:strand:+ start:307 stop:459 length:153 start_codon:yes stop_codon:yes gene_type:complete